MMSAAAEEASQVMTAPSNSWRREYSGMSVTEIVVATPPTLFDHVNVTEGTLPYSERPTEGTNCEKDDCTSKEP